MSLVPASTDRASTPANDETTAADSVQFRPEIGLAADGVVGLTDLLPTLAGGAANVAAGSFFHCLYCAAPFRPKHDVHNKKFCSREHGQKYRNAARLRIMHPPTECRWCREPVEQSVGKRRRYFCCRDHCVSWHSGKSAASAPAVPAAASVMHEEVYRGERYDAPGRTVVIPRAAVPLILRPSTYVYSEATS